MRTSLAWALAATIVLSLVAWWTQDRAPALVAAVAPALQGSEQGLPGGGVRGDADRPFAPPLPTELPAFSLDAATRDILASHEPAAPAPVAVARPVAPAPMASEPSAPQAPPLQLRYAGSMRAPDGRRIVYLSRGDASFEVAVGDRLDEGYFVETIGEEAISLVYPPLGTKVTVAMPPAPTQ
ncbi:hypothetical protein [Variovorax sp. YR752]|uniref:hypothetical protein n=1 Tax=Variovorax sp. YR752 TaxID=1884383 RepID=UPI003138013D